MGKQAIGTIGINQYVRTDGLLYTMVYPHKPMVKTRSLDIINFDNIPNALLALYTMSTTEGWVIFMNNAVNSRGIGFEPKEGSNGFYKVIFIIYMIFGSLFITNLFIEVVINTFHVKKRQLDRNYTLTSFQKEWIQLQIKCYNTRPETQIYT